MTFKKTIYTKNDLISVLNALDELGKRYIVSRKFKENDFPKGGNEGYWEVEELSADESVNVGNLTVNITAKTTPELDELLKKIGEHTSAAGVSIAEALKNIIVNVNED